MLLLVIPITLADECPVKDSFTYRLLDTCTIEGNGVCEDGENIFLNEDCKFKFDELFTTMWFVRLVLIMAIISIVFDSPTRWYVFGLFIVLCISNGAIPVSEREVVGVPVGACSISNAGGCLLPHYPIIGWLIIVVIGYYIFKYFYLHMRRPIYRRRY